MSEEKKKRQSHAHPGYLSTSDVAKLLGLSRPTIYSYIEGGVLTPAKRVVTLRGYTQYLFTYEYIQHVKRLMEEYAEGDEEEDHQGYVYA